MSRSARLLDLIQALRRRRRPVTAAALAAELGTSVRTVYRDVATLTAQGAPIVGEAGLGYVLKPGFLLPPLMFGADEVDALMIGLRLVEERGDPALARAAADVRAKVAAVLPAEAEAAMSGSGLLAGPAPAIPGLAVIRHAIRAEHVLHLDYADAEATATRRAVWPVAIGFFHTAEVLAAWCETRSDFRHFRLDRIGAIEATGLRYPRRRRTLLAEWRQRQGIAADRI